jgi:hypothetical protein
MVGAVWDCTTVTVEEQRFSAASGISRATLLLQTVTVEERRFSAASGHRKDEGL